MRAIVVSAYGGPETLAVTDVPTPTPGPCQVTIDVAFAGVNYAEVMARRGALPAFSPPFIPGLEVSGTVRECGDGVSDFEPGQPVAALTTRGGYAEVAPAPAALTYPLADGEASTLAAGAALPTIVPTAWALVHEVARLRESEVVLVQAAAGGVGTVLGQVLRAAGASRVLGVVGTDEKAAYARRFGYHEAFSGAGWEEQVRAEVGEAGIDVVFDSIGGEVRERGFDLLGPLGRIVFYGNACDAPEVGFAGSLLRAEVRSTMGFSTTALSAKAPQRAREIALQALEAVNDGQLEVPVTATFPLSRAGEAHELLEGRTSMGKLLLKI